MNASDMALARRCAGHVCMRAERPDLVDDVAAGAAFRFWRRFKPARGGREGTFMYVMAKDELFGLQRSEVAQHKKTTSMHRDATTPMEAPSPHEVLEAAERSRDLSDREARVRMALYALDDVEFDIVFSAYALGERMQVTAARHGLHFSNVYRRRAHTMEKLALISRGEEIPGRVKA